MLNSWNKTSPYHHWVYNVMVENNFKKNCIKKDLCPNKQKEQHVVGTWRYLTALLSTSCISVAPLWSLSLFLLQHALTPEPTVLSQLMCLLVSHIFCLFLAYDMKPHKRYITLKFVTNSVARHLSEIFVRLNSVWKICVGIMSCLCAYAIYRRRADEMKCPL